MMYFEPFDKSTFEDFLREANTKPDYTTNAGSYYEELARKNQLIELLSKRIWDYDIELAKRFEEWKKNLESLPDDVMNLLIKWVEDGSFEHMLNTTLLNNKADIVTSEIEPELKNDKTYWYRILSTNENETDITPHINGSIDFEILGGE